MNKKLIFKILGIILGIEGVSLLIPFVIALVCRENTAVFGVTALLCLAVGLPLSRLHTAKSRLQNRDGYVAVALGWIVLSAFGALPYALSGCCGYVDALFETVSGFTTTGASIFGAPASLPRGIQLWRALTQWLGGMGVLVLLLALMPKLGEGSVNLMKAESPGPISSKLLPRTNDTAKMLYSIYILLTAAETLALRAARMPWFDAVTTALTTISTGGFSVRNESIAYYQSSAVNWIIVVFMFVSSVNFTLLFLAGTRRWREVLRSDELRVYSGIVFGSSALIALDLVLKTGRSVGSAIEHAAFQVTTLISTTGYCTEDFDLWPQFSRLVLLVVMFVGGCALASTARRHQGLAHRAALQGLKRDLRRILHTREVRPITLDGQRVEEDTISSVSLFFFAYMIILFFSALIVSLDELDFTSAFTASLTCISNVGPGLGLVGPTCNFAFSRRSQSSCSRLRCSSGDWRSCPARAVLPVRVAEKINLCQSRSPGAAFLRKIC